MNKNNLGILNNIEKDKKQIIDNFLDKVIGEKNEKSGLAKFGQDFKEAWNKHKYSRLATGVALSAGAVAATASGAFVLAGGLLAGRAALGSIGGYMASDAIFDVVNKKITKNNVEKLIQKTKETKDKSELKAELNTIYDEYKSKSKDEIIRLINEAEKKNSSKERIKKYVSVGSGLILGLLGGSRVAEAVSSPGINEASSVVKSKVENILSSKIDSKVIKDVFSDIKHDHPSQGYVTLEQSVRRIEGLKSGISLEHSEKLKSLNSSISKELANPQGKIISSMKKLGILKSSDNFEQVSRHLSQEKIGKILENAYSGENITENHSVASIFQNPEIPKIKPMTLADSLITNKPEVAEITTNHQINSHTFIKDKLEKGSIFSDILGKTKKIAIGSAIVLGGLLIGKNAIAKNNAKVQDINNVIKAKERGFLEKVKEKIGELRKKFKPKEKKQDQKHESSKNDELLEEDFVDFEIAEEKEKEIIKQNLQKDNTQKNQIQENKIQEDQMNKTIEEEKQDKLKKRCFIIIGEIKNTLGFQKEEKIIDEDNATLILPFRKKTIGGDFVAIYRDNMEKSNIQFLYLENGICKAKIDSTFDLKNDFSRENFRKVMINQLQKLYIQRDKLKNIELAENLRMLEIPKNDISKIYEQLEHPEIVRNGYETGGYWHQNIYNFKDGILRLENLWNPKYNEMEISSVGFCLNDLGNISANISENDYLTRTFDIYEKWLLIKTFNDLSDKNSEGASLSGHVQGLNWHKHPGYLHTPSTSDLNNPTALIENFNKNPTKMTITYGIVNKLSTTINETNIPKNSIIMRGRDYNGSKNDYIIYFWKVNRNKENKNYRIEDCIPLTPKLV